MFIKQCVAAIAAFFISSMAFAEYPTKPIQIIVPFNAGGGMDVVIRSMTSELEQELGQPVVIVNLAGAGGGVGTAKLAESTPDGYTIGMSGGSTFGTNQIFNKSIPYDAIRDFEFVSMIGTLPRVVAVRKGGEIKTIADLKHHATHNSQFNMAASLNSPDILMAEIFKHQHGGVATIVPFGSGTNVMMIDLLADRIHAVWNSVPALNACLSNDTCTPLAVTGHRRVASMPDVPTFAELGLGQVDAPAYYGIVTPRGVDPAKIVRLNTAFNKVIAKSEVKDKLLKLGVVTIIASPDQTQKYHIDGITAAKKHAAVAGIVPK